MARRPDPKSKAGFVRSLPSSIPAADVVKAGSAKGIKLDVQYVYAVRTAKKKRAKTARAGSALPRSDGGAGVGNGRLVSAGGGQSGNGLVAEIERIVDAKVTSMLKARLGALFGG
jgi:hypothetical protein